MTFFIIAVFCYTFMQFIETVSFGSRLAGKLVNRLSLGTTLQNSIYVTSRLFLPPLLFSLSFLIESSLNIQSFILTSMTLIIAALLTSLLVLINFNYFQLLFQSLFQQYQYNSIPMGIVKVFFGKKNKLNLVHLEVIPGIWSLSLKKILTSAVAYFFLSTGFLIAFGLAILIPEYRMTVSQSASAFHGIGALTLALYIDPMISRSLDTELQNSKWLDNIYSIFVGRLLAYLIALIMLLGLYFYM